MRCDILAVITFAALATANRKPNPWDPLDVRSLKKCQADCVHSTLPKLGDGKFVILQTPNENFCASPDLKQWLRDDLFPCGGAACGRKARAYAKRGMTWLRNTCPKLTFTEAEFAPPPAGQPAPHEPAGGPESGGAPGGAPAGPESGGAPGGAPAGPESGGAPGGSPAGPESGDAPNGEGQPAEEGQGSEPENDNDNENANY